MADRAALPAGEVTAWVTEMRTALRGEGDADVPCDGCTACCRSSQFVHIEPEEVGTLARVPRELLVPAPGLPPGHVLLGHDDRGHCPMLVDDACSIYADRPRTCRTYDCRVFAAADVELGDDETKVDIARRVERWQFETPTKSDRARLDAVRAAARFLHERGSALPQGTAPRHAAEHAVLAVELHELFLTSDGDGVREPDEEHLAAELERRRAVRAGT